MRANTRIAYTDAVSCFGLKFVIEIVLGNKIKITDSRLRNQCFDLEGKMKFRRGGDGVPQNGNLREDYEYF